MAKVNKKKTRIKLNDSLNSQLDAMEDNGVAEVFAPKNSAQLNFYDMVNEAMELEELENNKKVKRKKKVVVKDNVSHYSMKTTPILLTILLFALFGGFVFLLWNLLF